VLYDLLPFAEIAAHYRPYNAAHIFETLQVLLFTACAFFVLVKLRKIEPHAGVNVDLDYLYRKGGQAFLWLAKKPIQLIDTGVGELYRVAGLLPLMKFSREVGVFDGAVIDGVVDGFAASFRSLGQRLRVAQRGALQENLTIAFALAALLLLGFLYFL